MRQRHAIWLAGHVTDLSIAMGGGSILMDSWQSSSQIWNTSDLEEEEENGFTQAEKNNENHQAVKSHKVSFIW